MTDEERTPSMCLCHNPELASIKRDIDLHAFNLNVALIKYKEAGVNFDGRRSLAYMLAATELYLKEEAEPKPS